MQRNPANLKEKITSANKLMSLPSDTTSDSKQTKETFEIYKLAINSPEYLSLDLPIRLAIFYNLIELINQLPEVKDEILKSLVKQFICEITSAEEQVAENLLVKIYSRISEEKPPIYLERLQENYDLLSDVIKNKQKAITIMMLKDRLAYATKLTPRTEGSSEEFKASAPNPQTVLKNYQTIFKYYRAFTEPYIQQIEIFVEKAEDSAVRLQSHLLLASYYAEKSWDPTLSYDRYSYRNGYGLFFEFKHGNKDALIKFSKLAINSLEIAAKLAVELKQEFNQQELILAYHTYAYLTSDVETYLKAANLGSFQERVYAADLLANTNINLAIDQYLLALKEALPVANTKVLERIITKIFYIEKDHRKKLSAEANKAIEQMILFAFKYPKFAERELFPNISDWKDKIIEFSFEVMDQVIKEMHKSRSSVLEFLKFAESCYSSKLKESAEAVTGFTLYSGLRQDMENSIAAYPNFISDFVKTIIPQKMTQGQVYRETVQSYFKIHQVDNNGTLFKAIKETLVKKLEKDLEGFINDNEYLYIDLAALLDISNANENAILIQKEFVNVIFKMSYKISIPTIQKPSHQQNEKINTFSNTLLRSYAYLNYFSKLAVMTSDSPFYEFAEPARSVSDKFREDINTALTRSAFYYFLTRKELGRLYYLRQAPLNISRGLGCPYSIAEHVINIVPSLFHLMTKDRHALLVSAHFLVSSANRNVMKISSGYLPSAGDVWNSEKNGDVDGNIVAVDHYGNRYKFSVSDLQQQWQQEIVKTLNKALSLARNFLIRKASDKSYEYYNLAKFLLGFVKQAEQSKKMIDAPIVFLWIKMRQSGIKPEDKKHYEDGLLRFVAEQSDKLLSEQDSIKWFSSLDTCVDASMPGFGSRKGRAPTAPELEHKPTIISSAPSLVADVSPTSSESKDEQVNTEDLSLPLVRFHYPLPEEWDPEKYKTRKSFVVQDFKEKTSESAPSTHHVFKQELKQETKSEEQAPASVPAKQIGQVMSAPTPAASATILAAPALVPAMASVPVSATIKEDPVLIQDFTKETPPRLANSGMKSAEGVASPLLILAGERPISPKPVLAQTSLQVITQELKAEVKSDEGVPSPILVRDANKSDPEITSTEGLFPLTFSETEPGAESLSRNAITSCFSATPTLFAEQKRPATHKSNSITASIEIVEAEPGVLSMSAEVTSPEPINFSFGIYKAHLLFQHTGFTPTKISEPYVYLDAPEGISFNRALLNISLDISDTKENGFKLITTQVTASDVLRVTPVTLNLSLFSQQRKSIIGNAPFVSNSSWVKTPRKV